jgi:hypothetical protein
MKQPFIIGPSRNRIIQAAWAGLDAERRAEKKVAAPAATSRPKDEPVRSEAYRRLVAAMPCKNCGRQKRSQAAHVPPEGKAIKVDDRETFPLCADEPRRKGCHPKFDQYELMPREQAVAQAKKWAAETRAEIIEAEEWPKNLPRWEEKPSAGRSSKARPAIKSGTA